MSRSLGEINQEYQHAAANLGALTFRKAVLDQQVAELIRRCAQLEQEAEGLQAEAPVEEAPKKGAKAAERRARAIAKAEAVRARRGSKK